MNKTVVWMGGLVVLAAAGFGGLVSWQASEVERFDGMTIPLPGDLVSLHAVSYTHLTLPTKAEV